MPFTPPPQSSPPPPLFDILDDATKLVSDFFTVVLPDRKIIFDDWFKESDLGFVYAPRGLGKTWLAFAVGLAIASGGRAGPWLSQVAWPVLYVDGEMMFEDDKNRISGLNGSSPSKLQFHLLNHEVLFQSHQTVLNLGTIEAQEAITKLCLHRGVKVLVLDNLSCLFSGVPENDADAWEQVLPWLLHLRRQRIAIVIIHHAGVNKERMRGTSKREDGAGWVLRLDLLENCGTGSHFISRFTKVRGKTPVPDYEWHFRPNGTKTDVSFTPANRADAVLQWVIDGLDTCEAIAKEMGISAGGVSKLATKLIYENKMHKRGRRYVPGPDPPPVNASFPAFLKKSQTRK